MNTLNPFTWANTLEEHRYFSAKSAWSKHLPFAAAILELQKPKIFVELGTHYGDSYLAFCRAIELLSIPTKAFAIDTWQGDEHSERYGSEVLLSLRAAHDRHYSNFSTLMQMKFDKGLDFFADNSVDLLHIDGLHTYNAVQHDFDSWLPKLSSTAIVLFHDTNVRERDFGVWKVWLELSKKYPSCEFKHGHGLGIIGVGAQLNEEVKELFSLSEKEHHQVEKYFANLGSILEKNARLNSEITTEHTAKEKLQAETHDLSISLNDCKAELLKCQLKLEEQRALSESISETLVKPQELLLLDLRAKIHELESINQRQKTDFIEEIELQSLKFNSANEELQAQVVRQQDYAQQLEQSISDIAKSQRLNNSTAAGNLKSINFELINKSNQISTLSKDTDWLRAQWQSVIQSTTWKITFPLRVALHQIKKFSLPNNIKPTTERIAKQPSISESNSTDNVAISIDNPENNEISPTDLLQIEIRDSPIPEQAISINNETVCFIIPVSGSTIASAQFTVKSAQNVVSKSFQVLIVIHQPVSLGELSCLRESIEPDLRFRIVDLLPTENPARLATVFTKINAENLILLEPGFLITTAGLEQTFREVNQSSGGSSPWVTFGHPSLILRGFASELSQYFQFDENEKWNESKPMPTKLRNLHMYWQAHGSQALLGLIFLKLSQSSNAKARIIAENIVRPSISESQAATVFSRRFSTAQPFTVLTEPSKGISRVNVLTDSIGAASFYGGVGTSILFAAELAKKQGASLRLITRSDPPNILGVKQFLDTFNINFKNNIETEFLPVGQTTELPIHSDDTFVTTSWWTTSATMASVDPRKIIYLLQEDERMFYPYSDDRRMAELVMKNDRIRFAINSKLLFDHLIKDDFLNIEKNGYWFEPAFPDHLYKKSNIPKTKKRLFFYARPNHARNLYHLGIQVLETAFSTGVLKESDWELYTVGKDAPELIFGSGLHSIRIENLSWLDYTRFAGTVDLAISLMYTPHPSYPPLDMAACGAVVVTNSFGVKKTLESYSKNIICAEPNVDDLVSAIATASLLTVNEAERSVNHEQSQLSRNWENTLREVITKLSEKNV